ncbi:MAG: serine hydrolase domain-containing protein [Flavobacteriales bacterium]
MNKKWLFFVGLTMLLSACHVGRFFVYNFANINDYKKFKNKEIKNSATKNFMFSYSMQSEYANLLKEVKKNEQTVPFEEFLKKSNTVAFLVIVKDTIHYEWYHPKHNETTRFTSFSMAKSYISALVGIAVDEGFIKSVNEPITNYIKTFKNKGFDKITIEHVLNMRAGIKYVESYYNPFGNVAVGYYGRHLDRHMNKIKIKEDPDLNFEYISIATQILGVIVEEAAGKTVSAYAEEKLWKPLGTEYDASWSLDKKNGREKAFCCINARTRDYARFGRLYLKEGNWEGSQLISKDWVKKSTQKGAYSKDAFYAYQWWHVPEKDKNGKQIIRPDFYAQGHLGQYIYVSPSEEIIIVRLGENRGGIPWISQFRQLATKITQMERYKISTIK